MKKDNTWNIRRLVNETIVPWTHHIMYIEDCRTSENHVTFLLQFSHLTFVNFILLPRLDNN